MNPLKTLRLIGAMALLPASAHAAVLYNGFGSSTPGNSAPQGWSISGTPTGTSSITAEHYLAMSTAGTSVFAHFNTGSGISRTAGQGFKLTSTFSGTSGNGQYENTGFYFMNSSDGNTSGPRVLFNMGSNLPGTLEFAGTANNSNGSMAAGKYTELEGKGAIYTMTLTGIFSSGGMLTLTATLTNSIDGTVVTSTSTLSSAAGNYFGIRTASGGNDSPTSSATHYSYVLETIPEPSHTLMLAAGGVAMLVRRRRMA